MSNPKQREDDKKMTIAVAYGCLVLNLNGYKQAASILIDNGITLDEFKKTMFDRKEKISVEMEKLFKKLQIEMRKRLNGS